MEKLKRLWRHRPRLSRGWKTARNLALVVLLCVGYWFIRECPAFTSEGALRKEERTMLLEPGRTIYEEWDGLGKRRVCVLGDDYAYTGSTSRDWSEVNARIKDGAAREDGVTLLRLPAQDGFPPGELNQTVVICPWGPEKAERVELTLCADYFMETYPLVAINDGSQQARGETLSLERRNWTWEARTDKEPDGWYRFTLYSGTGEAAAAMDEMWDGIGYFTTQTDAGETETNLDLEQANYQLDFYGADGALMESVQGELEHRG